MNTMLSSPKLRKQVARAPLEAVLALAEHVAAMLRVAEGLLTARRAVRLDGIERHVGHLCASALDLPAEQGREARTRLILLALHLDRVRGHLAPR